jgi:hypothetical protein
MRGRCKPICRLDERIAVLSDERRKDMMITATIYRNGQSGPEESKFLEGVQELTVYFPLEEGKYRQVQINLLSGQVNQKDSYESHGSFLSDRSRYER